MRHHSNHTTMSEDESPAAGSPYMVSDRNRVNSEVGRGKKGGRRHQPSGAKRASATSAVGHSQGRVATARTDPNTALAASMAATPAG